jgi:FecR protein
MNTVPHDSRAAKLISIVVSSLLVCAGALSAAELKEARVTQVVKDVKLLPEAAAPRPASVNDDVRNGTAVRTGVESRTELTFTDQTLARLGANTIFSFNEGTRNLDLKDGAMLLRVPKNSGGAKINTAAITAAITGTTVMIETHPVTNKSKGGFYKFIVLEGTARLFLPGHIGESVLVHAGQMIIMRPDGKKVPNPVDVDISQIMQTSLLIRGFPQLPSAQLIALQEQQQTAQKSSGQLYNTNLVIFGGGTNVSLTDPTNTDAISVANSSTTRTTSAGPPPTPPPSPPPTPPPSSKFGALSVITSPDPFVINSATRIQTDPIITANGQTNSGRIWRGPSIDGPLSVYAFGSTSAFDLASGFDTRVIGNTNGAAFKFNSLQLTGNPTVSTTNGAINLGLFAINGITSGAPGGTLTFAGIRGLLLATQNGPIDLGSEISFSGLHDLIFYARGTNSDLTLSSALSGVTNTTLIAQRDVNVDGTTLGTQALAVIAGANINLGVNTPVTINASEAALLIPNSGGNIAGDTTITLNPAGNLTLNGANGLSLTIDNSNGGHIGQSAQISLNAASLSAGSLNAFINNRNGGSIGSSAQVLLNISGALNTQGDATVGTSNRNDGGGGGTTTGNAIVNVQANSISVGGTLTGFVTANGGQIGGTGSLTFNVAGNIDAGAGLLFQTQSDAYNGSGGALTPGSIGSDAIIGVRASNLTSGGFIESDLFNNGGGHIHGNATNTLSTSGDINAQDYILASIVDTAFSPNGGVASPSHIDGSALLILNGRNIITASTDSGTPGQATMALEASVYTNVSGTVTGDAAISVTASQNITAPGTALFWVANGNFQSLGPGTIGGNALVSVSGVNISTGNLFDQVLNYGGSSIGGDAAVALDATNLSVNGTFDTRIDNTAGTLSGNASMIYNTATALTSTGDQFYQLINADGGRIGGSATLDINTKNLSSGGALFVAILNSTNDGGATGTVAGNAVLNMNVSGTTTVATDATFQINGSDSAASSAINFNGGTYDVPNGTFEGFMDGNGTMTFNNAIISADTVKAGVFGPNGVLRIGGGSISANTLLHLYATGSNGLIDFVSNVTLNSSSTAAVIAANTVTVENGVVVTIAGSTPANVFANVPNYTGSGGNGSTRGTFGGAGATTQPLSGAPPFARASASTRNATALASTGVKGSSSHNGLAPGDSALSRVGHPGSSRVSSSKHPAFRVTDSSELGSLLDNALVAKNSHVVVSPPGIKPDTRVRNGTRSTSAAADVRPLPGPRFTALTVTARPQ